MLVPTSSSEVEIIWLYHKLDGIDGNKKPTEFSESEKIQLRAALIDLSRRIEKAATEIQI